MRKELEDKIVKSLSMYQPILVVDKESFFNTVKKLFSLDELYEMRHLIDIEINKRKAKEE